MQICPNADFSKELGPSIDRESWIRERQPSAGIRHKSAPSPTLQPSPKPIPLPQPNPDGLDPSDDEDGFQVEGLADQLKEFQVGYRFFGKSSGVRLIKTALDFKSEYSGKRVDSVFSSKKYHRKEFWSVHPVTSSLAY
jgi:hypothetical protein